MSEQTPYIFDATTADFDQSVIEASFNKPVLVDFWAEWCAPCKALMPMLQTIAESYQGELLLAKVNCDVEPDIVSRLANAVGDRVRLELASRGVQQSQLAEQAAESAKAELPGKK